MDTDNSGFVSMSELLHVMLIFNKGTFEEKAQLYFNIYDLDHSGFLTSEDFFQIVRSNIGTEMKEEDLQTVVNNMLASIGMVPGGQLTFDQFLQAIKKESAFVEALGIDIESESKNANRRFSIYGALVKGGPVNKEEELNTQKFAKSQKDGTVAQNRYTQFGNFIKSRHTVIFWGFLYTIVMILVFAERAYYYSVEREHAGLRRIAGYGVTVTRGAASAMMFTYSTILLTMCRNILSALRSTFLHIYFPFDNMVGFHKYIGWWALFWTVLHVFGHAINFYHISNQTASDLACIFRDYYRPTHILPKFHYWCWETITGLTGVFLTLQIAIIYAFAVSARLHIFKWFWYTHNTYPLFYLLLILHGSGNLVQPPLFLYFFIFPVVCFVIDKLISISRNSIEIDIVRTTHLPSNVTLLHIRRPHNFNFQSGQWIRIASTSISMQEFHPFTLSSAPHENYLTLHIRGVGPWTNRLRKVYPDYNNIKNDPNFKYPKVLVDGPFGEGHQNWWDYEVVVFVGGGIGVTPFASILKDIVFRSKQPYSSFKCRRVMFLWVTRSQKQFEWLINILRQVEEADIKDIVRIHIFITQFKSKYDMRTILLYMAERHFQKLSGKSMFTGLKAITHFSRPDFPAVFQAVKNRYQESNIIGVFTCGNPSLSASVEEGCRIENKNNGPVLKHYYENF